MKKLLALLLALTMLLCLAACGDDTKKDDKKDDKGGTTAAAASTEAEGDSTTTTTVGESDPTVTDNGETSATVGDETSAAPSESTTAGTQAPTSATKTPTSATKTPTSATKAPTTTTTQPTQPEEPDQPADDRPTIKILSIGHSFSRDAMDTYMADLFKAAGYNATFGYLYYPGASLERQYHYIKDNSSSYQMYNKCVDGKWYRSEGSASADQAFTDEDWDIVTFQPSPDYGKGDVEYTCSFGCNREVTDYDHFDQLVKMVKDRLSDFGNPDVKFYWHLTWAFATDCKLWSFTYSNWDQKTMFWDFIKATGKYVTPNPYVEDAFIPCITSIQNVRTSWMGDTFNEPGGSANADGYHLNDKGDLVAAMTWVAFFTGKSPTEFKIATKYSDAQYAAFAEAVDNAIKKPLNITKSSYTTEP